MFKREYMPHLMGAATLALLFSAASVHPQTTDANTKGNAAGSPAATAGAGATSSGSTAGSDSKAGARGDKAGKDSTLSRGDRNILEEMAHANLAEIAMGKLALEKSQDDKVKQYAQKMVDDHTTALKEVQKVAEAKGVKLPDQPDAKHRTMAKGLEKLSAEEFDKKYMAQGGLADHKKTHKQLESAQKNAKDPDVKALATKMLPTVEQHLQTAQSMTGSNSAAKAASGDSKMDKGKSSGSSGSSGSAGASGSSGAAGTKGESSSSSK